MTTTILDDLGQLATTSLVSFGDIVATGRKRKIDIRAANITSNDATIDLYLHYAADTAKNYYRCKGYTLTAGEAVDLEIGFMQGAGWILQIRSGVANSVHVSRCGVERS